MHQSGMQDMLLQLLEKPVLGLKKPKSCTVITDLLVAKKIYQCYVNTGLKL